MNYPLKLSFKLLAIASQIYIRDANGQLLGYVKQKLLKLKEDINVFADEQQTQHLYNIKADRVLDFSGGMKRRLELARALLHEPSLLIMDEPTTGLDERFFRQSWERIEALRDSRGLTVLLTTHRAEEAERCDRVAVVDQGRVIAQDTPEALRGQVAGDVLTLEARDPEALGAELAERFALQPRVVEGKLVIERERGHELIPRIVEALPVGRIASLSMHRPTLSDVFVKLTGRSLADEAAPDPQPKPKA